MAEDWQDRIRGIAGALLTLEVNTIEKENMSAAKMPEVPMALHELMSRYVTELEGRKFFVTDALLQAAAERLANPEDPIRRQALENWTFHAADRTSEALTNGPVTFEALAWAAMAAKRQLDDAAISPPAATPPNGAIAHEALAASRVVAVDRVLLQRLISYCRQLRQITLLLRQQFAAQQVPAGLIDGTLEQTTAVLFRHPRPVLAIDTDVLVQLRKIWDIGLETVQFQTVLQVDGDVLLRVASGMDEARRNFYGELHRATVETGIRQWKSLFDLVTSLVSGLGSMLFGGRT